MSDDDGTWADAQGVETGTTEVVGSVAPVAYRADEPVTYHLGDTAVVPSVGGPPLYGGGELASVEEDDPWPSHAARHGIRLRVPTAVLVVLLVAAGAFWGGAAVQKNQGSGTGAGGAFAALRSEFAGRGTGTGASSRTGGASSFFGRGGAGTSTAAATGTVTVVNGNLLYVTTASGTLVKVEVPSTVKVTRNASSSLSDVQPGDTVVVEGVTAKNGTVTASSIAATADGVTTASPFGAASTAAGG